MNDPVVEVRGVVRRFGPRTALDGVDFELRRGRIAALVGPNGSGKTTLLKLLAGFLHPTTGTVRVFGLDPHDDRTAVMTHARFAFAPSPFYGQLTARETLTALVGIGGRRVFRPGREEIRAVLETVGLADRADDRVRVYSFGMRQRLALAQALIPTPQLLVLDEPTDGLDPLAIIELRDVLLTLRRERGVTILLSSHHLVEVNRLADELLLLHEGVPLFRGPPGALLDQSRRLCLTVEGDGAEARRAEEALKREGYPSKTNGRDEIVLPAGAIRLEDAARLLDRAGVRLRSFHEPAPSLEDALLARLRAAGSAVPPPDEPARPNDSPPGEEA